MRMIKFAVVLCFAAALVTLSNYPQLVTGHGVAPKVLEVHHIAYAEYGRSCSDQPGCHGVTTKFHGLRAAKATISSASISGLAFVTTGTTKGITGKI